MLLLSLKLFGKRPVRFTIALQGFQNGELVYFDKTYEEHWNKSQLYAVLISCYVNDVYNQPYIA